MQELVDLTFAGGLGDNADTRFVFIKGLSCVRPITSKATITSTLCMRTCRIEDIRRSWSAI
jgi:hypothetical protein